MGFFPSTCSALNPVPFPWTWAPSSTGRPSQHTVSVCLSPQSRALRLYADAQDHGHPSQSHNPLCDRDGKIRNAGPGPRGLVQLCLQPQGSRPSWTCAIFSSYVKRSLGKLKWSPCAWMSQDLGCAAVPCKYVIGGQMCVRGFPSPHSK